MDFSPLMVTPPLRAVFFDVYNTLLKVGPAPSDAVERWQDLLRRFRLERLPDLIRFQQGNEAVVARHHVRARTIGIGYPEVYWPKVVMEAWPPTRRLTSNELDDFLLGHATLTRTTVLNDGAATLLGNLCDRRILLGVVSNAQPYTVHELNRALKANGFAIEPFAADFCFWSFEAGFSKPDPYVFRWLEGRLRRLAINAPEALIVGDRPGNDILPARAHGFQTWLMSEAGAPSPADGCGTFQDLNKIIESIMRLPS